MISGPIFLMTVEGGTPPGVIRLHINRPDQRVDTVVRFLIHMAASGTHYQVFDCRIMMGFLQLRQPFGSVFPAPFLLYLIEISRKIMRPLMQGGIDFIQVREIILIRGTGSDTGGTALCR